MAGRRRRVAACGTAFGSKCCWLSRSQMPDSEYHGTGMGHRMTTLYGPLKDTYGKERELFDHPSHV